MKKTPSKENKKYIDDFASSSDEFDAASDNALPMVEQV